MDLSKAKAVDLDRGIYVVPAKDAICTIVADESATCTPSPVVGRAFDVQACGSIPQGSIGIDGLVPDNTTATIVHRDASRSGADVRENYLRAVIAVSSPAATPVAVELTDRNGTTSVPVSDIGDLPTCDK